MSNQKSTGPGKVITVMSPKGGVGRTVIATNLAITLAGWTDPNRVVLVDADLQFGDVALALQLDPKASFIDAARAIEELDAKTLGGMLSKHPSGVWVLPAPPDPLSAEDIFVDAVMTVIGRLRRMFEYVVVDTGAFLGEPMLSVVEGSDTVLLIVDPDLQTAKNAKLVIQALEMIKFPIDHIRAVLNRADRRSAMDIAELGRSLGVTVAAKVPEDPEVLVSINRGEPIVLARPRSKVAVGMVDVAKVVARPEHLKGNRR